MIKLNNANKINEDEVFLQVSYGKLLNLILSKRLIFKKCKDNNSINSIVNLLSESKFFFPTLVLNSKMSKIKNNTLKTKESLTAIDGNIRLNALYKYYIINKKAPKGYISIKIINSKYKEELLSIIS